MMGSCRGTGRGSQARWRKPLQVSVQGKGSEGRSLEWRSTGAGVHGCRGADGVCRHFPRSLEKRERAAREGVP